MIWAITSYCISLLLLAGYALFNTRLDGSRKWVFIPMFLALMGFAVMGFTQSLGYPLPLWAQFNKDDISVNAFVIDEPNNIIYIWGFLKGSNSPVAFEIEFDKETATRLYHLKRKIESEGGEMETHGVVGQFIEGTIEFNEAPPVRLEQKD